MSIQDHHLTDIELAQFGQSLLRETFLLMGTTQVPPLNVSTFFLNSDTLGGLKDHLRPEAAIRRKVSRMVPPAVAAALPSDYPQIFLGLGYLAFIDNGTFNVVLSRPNDGCSLIERVSRRTNIDPRDLTIDPKESVFGPDNIELIDRMYQIFNCLPNGGIGAVEAAGKMNQVRYRSMIGARHEFIRLGGEQKFTQMHEASAHIAAFTSGKIPYEYMGFMADLELGDAVVAIAYRNILDRLVDRHYTTKKSLKGHTEYFPVAHGDLLIGLSEAADDYLTIIARNSGDNLGALYRAVSLNAIDAHDKQVIKRLGIQDILSVTEHFIVFQTLKGLELLMGEHARAYVPTRSNDAYSQIHRLISARYS